MSDGTKGTSTSDPAGTEAKAPSGPLPKNYHHEVELVAALKSGGANIPAEKALDPARRRMSAPS